MDIHNSAEREKFLFIFGAPYKSFLNCLSLRSAVLLLTTIDLIIGTFNSLLGLGVFVGLLFSSIPFSGLAFFALISTIINVIGIPFAVIGLSGITQLSENNLHYYYQYEVFEMFSEGFLNLIEAELSSFYLDSENHKFHFHNLGSNVVIAIISILLSGITTKVVWSAYIRLKYEETVLVTHGEQAYIEMQNNAACLVSPKVITPGLPIYFSKTN